MQMPRELCQYGKDKIAQLRDSGLILTDADVIMINALCFEVESPAARQELARGTPVKLCDCWLWPWTVQGWHWFQRIGVELEDQAAAMGYALAHGSDKDLMTSGLDEVDAWYYNLTCTPDQYIQAIADVNQQDRKDNIPEDKNAKDNSSICELAAMMHAHHGGDYAQWEMHVSCEYIKDLVNVISAQAAADGGLPKILKARANLALYNAVKQIKERQQNGS